MMHSIHDVIVVVPGIMGSTLYRGIDPVWEPSRGAIVGALTSLFQSVKTLRMPEGIGDDHPGDGVRAAKLMPDIRLPFGMWTFDLGYTALLNFLRSTFDLVESQPGLDRPANLVTLPYDWRLSNRYNGALLKTTAERVLQRWRDQGLRYADAKLVFIAHSMGGLVARWYLDRLGGAEVTRKLITLGTPHRGALNALEQLCNGVRKGPGTFKVNLTLFARSLPSLHQLLPEYACIETRNGLAKTIELDVPELVSTLAADAMDFHQQIDAGRSNLTHSYDLHPIVGFDQPTWTTARVCAGRIGVVRTIEGKDERGDATVPCLSAAPPDVSQTSPLIRHIADNHGGLVHNKNVFDEIEGILTASTTRHRGGDIRVAVETQEVLEFEETLTIRAELPQGDRVSLEAVLYDAESRPMDKVRLSPAEGALFAQFEIPYPGVYQVTVRGVGGARGRVIPVTTAVLVWPPDSSFDASVLDGSELS